MRPDTAETADADEAADRNEDHHQAAHANHLLDLDEQLATELSSSRSNGTRLDE